MSTKFENDEAQWMAYVDGGLDAAAREAVEAAMAADPQLAARVQAQAALRSRLQRGLAAELEEPVPDRLAALLAPTPALELQSATGPRLSAPSPNSRWWLFAVAGLMAGLLLPRLLPQHEPDLRIDGRLAEALEQRLTGETAVDGWQMRLSYRAKDGAHCRAFSSASRAGLACKQSDGAWALRLLVPAANDAGSELRQASSGLPAALLAVVDAELEGSTLDAAAETEARRRGWR